MRWACPSVCLSVCLFVCLSVCLLVCQSPKFRGIVSVDNDNLQKVVYTSAFQKHLFKDLYPRRRSSAIFKVDITSFFSAVGGPLWISFRKLVQNEMSTEEIWLKSKAEVEF